MKYNPMNSAIPVEIEMPYSELELMALKIEMDIEEETKFDKLFEDLRFISTMSVEADDLPVYKDLQTAIARHYGQTLDNMVMLSQHDTEGILSSLFEGIGKIIDAIWTFIKKILLIEEKSGGSKAAKKKEQVVLDLLDKLVKVDLIKDSKSTKELLMFIEHARLMMDANAKASNANFVEAYLKSINDGIDKIYKDGISDPTTVGFKDAGEETTDTTNTHRIIIGINVNHSGECKDECNFVAKIKYLVLLYEGYKLVSVKTESIATEHKVTLPSELTKDNVSVLTNFFNTFGKLQEKGGLKNIGEVVKDCKKDMDALNKGDSNIATTKYPAFYKSWTDAAKFTSTEPKDIEAHNIKFGKLVGAIIKIKSDTNVSFMNTHLAYRKIRDNVFKKIKELNPEK